MTWMPDGRATSASARQVSGRTDALMTRIVNQAETVDIADLVSKGLAVAPDAADYP